MCGIVGSMVFNASNYTIEYPYINKMRDMLIHRGPDGGNTWISKDRKIGLAHRRLSIIDLSESANQPFSNEDGTIFVTFNGEIYNHMQIRYELNKIGKYKWKTTHSDTEVLVHAFEEWGIDCINKFIGMFAFAIWDSIKEELWLVRDRIGIKPLYYSIHDGRIVFSSEIKALLQDPNQKRELNKRALYDYLSCLTVPPPHTMFKGIKKIPCSTWIRINKKGNIYEKKYYDVLEHTKNIDNLSENEIADNILQLLKSSVNLRKESDVPVGVFLSGGIDSSVNATLFAEDSKSDVKTFTIGYTHLKSYKNENRYAKYMANKINAKYFEKIMSLDDLLSFLPQFIKMQDEPLADPVCIAQYYIAKLAKKNNITVCQLGEGSDELFSGYLYWNYRRKIERLSRIKNTYFLKKVTLDILSMTNMRDRREFELLRRSASGESTFWGSRGYLTEMNKQSILSKKMNEKFKHYTTWESIKPIYENFRQNSETESVLNWMTYINLNLRLPELLLMRSDRMCMSVSLEGRFPFLDHRLVEFAMSIPETIKIKNNIPKYILKESVKNILPNKILNRKKEGFGLPLSDWYSNKLNKIIYSELLKLCNKVDLFNREEIGNFLDKDMTITWSLFAFSLWYNEFIS